VSASDPTPDLFQVSATTSMQERRPRTLKHGDTFAVFDHFGDISPGDAAEGLFHRDTRYLSRMNLTLMGARPILLSAALRDDNATLTCDLTNPDIRNGEQLVVGHDLIHVRRSKFVFESACHERIAVRNFDRRTHRLVVRLGFDADFADLFEVRGARRERRGEMHPAAVERGAVTLAYTGLDGRRRETRLRFDPMPDTVAAGGATWQVDLPAGARAVFHVEVSCDAPSAPAPARETFYHRIRAARRALRRSAARAASVESSNDIFNEAARRSVADIYMLVTDTPQGAYPYAGIPWYSTVFGRDALITALQMLWMDPAIARGVLSYLAAHQADRTDPEADSEPGKILHEVRQGEMAELGEVPFRRYYGSVDATPLFVMLAGAYLARTGDVTHAARLWPHVEAALNWIDQHGDRDGDGFVEYHRMTSKGLANQGWKDSHDAVFHADGSAAQGPIALCEVQGYVHQAKRAAATIARAIGKPRRAAALETQAADLRDRIEAAFWLPDLGTYALALDGEKRPCRVRSSNAGHLLLAGVPERSRAEKVARQLLGVAFHSGWGIRTLASGEARYNPMSYHNGSVWPHDNALIAMGFARYGMREEAARILDGLFDASVYIDLRRLPELVCGFPRRRSEGPTFYPVACAPQAWSAATPLSLLQSCLGIGFDPVNRVVAFDHPVLPRCLHGVTLRNLAIGDARIDVALRGEGAQVAMTVLSRHGDIRATMTS
jgi:glycogen debranching enzyme